MVQTSTTAARFPRGHWLGSRWAIGAIALARLGLGAGMLARPALLPRVLGLDPTTVARAEWLVQMVGAREVALGLGGVWSTSSGDSSTRPAQWLVAQAIADAGDALGLSRALRERRVEPLAAGAIIAFALAGAGAEVYAAATCRTRAATSCPP